ncbi:LysR family transcriptional regulator [Mesorhizobium sp. M1340]|uniref:helix-turn-helix domain-containing protein n=1 Tax=unclassified Mesorhizobium TaxID=325217 RepID=UPI0033367D55
MIACGPKSAQNVCDLSTQTSSGDAELHSTRDLNYAIVVAEEGSFLRAVRRAGIDHTALSRRIRDLEYATGTSIFRRHARDVDQTRPATFSRSSTLAAAWTGQYSHAG